MTQDSSQALVNTGVSMTAAAITITQVQPFVTLLAGLVAIFSGIMAIRYYYNANKKVRKNDEVPK
jgi:purine-cytosine permease-like protein